MRRPLDTPERHEVVHSSPEISAAKHLARASGLRMRRRRRVGPLVYLLGESGLIQFGDTGALAAALIGGELVVRPRFSELDTLMQSARFWENERTLAQVELTTVDSGAVPDSAPRTGPIPVPGHPELTDELVLILPQEVPTRSHPFAEATPALFLVPSSDPIMEPVTTSSIAIVAVATGAIDLIPQTRELAIIEVRSGHASRASLWGRFFGWVTMFFLAAVVGIIGLYPATVVWEVAVSVVLASIAMWQIVASIHANDRRLAALKAVGFR